MNDLQNIPISFPSASDDKLTLMGDLHIISIPSFSKTIIIWKKANVWYRNASDIPEILNLIIKHIVQNLIISLLTVTTVATFVATGD